jgi:hypothetical protein
MTVFLDGLAWWGGVTVNLYTTGGIGTVPATVIVAQGSSSATFNLTTAVVPSSGTVVAQIGVQYVTADITVVDP